jgi:hypothetical protein
VRCEDCGLIEFAGEWRAGPGPVTEVRAGRCPACQRVRARRPAGTLRLHPEFLADRAELLRMIRNVERAESSEHPLERLIDTEESDGTLVVTTTGVHLARALAHKLARRFHKKPRLRYAPGETRLFVDWELGD